MSCKKRKIEEEETANILANLKYYEENDLNKLSNQLASLTQKERCESIGPIINIARKGKKIMTMKELYDLSKKCSTLSNKEFIKMAINFINLSDDNYKIVINNCVSIRTIQMLPKSKNQKILLQDVFGLKFIIDPTYRELICNNIANSQEQLYIKLNNIESLIEIKNISNVNYIEIINCVNLKYINNVNNVNKFLIKNSSPQLNQVCVKILLIEP
jgi:hypothetical protein